jgi:hypothetical protein
MGILSGQRANVTDAKNWSCVSLNSAKAVCRASEGGYKVNTTDPFELAFAIAQIACDTKEPDTALRLLDLADRLLTAAGLPIIAPGQFAGLSSCPC